MRVLLISLRAPYLKLVVFASSRKSWDLESRASASLGLLAKVEIWVGGLSDYLFEEFII